MQDDKQPGLSWSTPTPAPAVPIKEPAPVPQGTGPSPAPGLGFPSSKKAMVTNAPAYAATLAVGVIAGVLLAHAMPPAAQRQSDSLAAAAGAQLASSTPEEKNAHRATPTAAALTVADQKAGPSVVIQGLNVARPTWVVVYVSREGKPGNALGARLFFASDKEGSVGLLRNTQAGQSYFVGLSVDNGDRAFSLAKDKPVADADGGALWATFRAL